MAASVLNDGHLKDKGRKKKIRKLRERYVEIRGEAEEEKRLSTK